MWRALTPCTLLALAGGVDLEHRAHVQRPAPHDAGALLGSSALAQAALHPLPVEQELTQARATEPAQLLSLHEALYDEHHAGGMATPEPTSATDRGLCCFHIKLQMVPGQPYVPLEMTTFASGDGVTCPKTPKNFMGVAFGRKEHVCPETKEEAFEIIEEERTVWSTMQSIPRYDITEEPKVCAESKGHICGCIGNVSYGRKHQDMFLSIKQGAPGSASPCPQEGKCLYNDKYCVNRFNGQCGMLESEVNERCGMWPECGGVICGIRGAEGYCMARRTMTSKSIEGQYGYLKNAPGEGAIANFTSMTQTPIVTMITSHPINCTDETFGGVDPVPGFSKHCYCMMAPNSQFLGPDTVTDAPTGLPELMQYTGPLYRFSALRRHVGAGLRGAYDYVADFVGGILWPQHEEPDEERPGF